MTKFDRRAALRGMMYGGAVTVGLPFLECFLNDSGTALANGMPLPARFGTWFWGLGTQKQITQPTKFGPDYDLRGELVPLKAVKQHVNVFSNFATPTDGRPNFVHHTGAGILRCGQAPVDIQSLPSETIDVTISDAIGGASRFSSLEMTATADRSHSYSARGPNAVNPPEVSPVEFYQRVYGPEFQNPNSPVFKPNPELVLRKSVLSAVLEDSTRLKAHLGAADKARLDEYFTSLRGMEQRLALQLKKPPPAEQCYVPEMPKGVPEEGLDWALVSKRHNAMTDILVAALSCNQTRVFNMVYSWSAAGTIKEGLPTTHHITTHEETKNKEGFQEWHEWFVLRAMESWAYFVNKLASVREGDGTLLDNTLVYAHSEHGNAQTHSLEGIPVMTAGRGGGAVKTGIHFDGKDKPATQIGLSLMHAMGLKTAEWGFGSIKTNQTVDGFLV
jgi:hypothetical protein